MNELVIAAAAVVVVLAVAQAGRYFSSRRRPGAGPRVSSGVREKGDALFVSMFPELQPHFHPENLVTYVKARRGRTPPRSGFTWQGVPGFKGAAVDIRFEGERELCKLVDAAGAILANFRYEATPQGGVLRLAPGKLTVDLAKPEDPAVRYWHPEREFKWTRRGGWRFKTPVAEREIEPRERGTTWSDTPSSSSGDSVAPFAGKGGTFDGGGASSGWGGPSPGATAAATGAAVAAAAVAGTALAGGFEGRDASEAGDSPGAAGDAADASPGSESSDSSGDDSTTSY